MAGAPTWLIYQSVEKSGGFAPKEAGALQTQSSLLPAHDGFAVFQPEY